jgi:uncharacterized protein Yka (UPF0111/DUF47 family)
MSSEDLSNTEDAVPEAVSTLEALDDVAGDIETIVLNLGEPEEREAYLELADEYDSYADSLAEPALRTPEQSARLLELEKQMEEAFEAILQECPEHIRTLYEAVRAAISSEEELEA